MEQERLFRTAINGFNKSDVYAFIAEQNTKFSKAEQEHAAAVSELKKRVAELEQTLEQAKVSLGQTEEENRTLITRHDSLVTETDRLRYECNGLKLENGRLRSLEAEQLESLKTLREKALLYDSTTRQISDVMIRARQDADNILSDAIKNAQDIKTHISGKFASALELYEEFRGNVRTVKYSTLEAIDKMRFSVLSFDKRMNEIHDDLLKIGSMIDADDPESDAQLSSPEKAEQE